MTEPKDLAYPVITNLIRDHEDQTNTMTDFHRGLSKLEWFAGMAIQGLLANPSTRRGLGYEREVADEANRFAEMMIEELNRAK